MQYREQYGPFNPAIRTDAAVGRAIAYMRGGKVSDYMPWPKEEEPEATIDGVFGLLKSAADSNKRKA